MYHFPISTPRAPVRFLADYDNVVLGHADRSRIVPPGIPQWTDVGWGTVLVDGLVRARWRLERTKDAATLQIEPFARLARADRTELLEEGGRLLTFVARNAETQDVRVLPG
jgi:hypothetical protein